MRETTIGVSEPPIVPRIPDMPIISSDCITPIMDKVFAGC